MPARYNHEYAGSPQTRPSEQRVPRDVSEQVWDGFLGNFGPRIPCDITRTTRIRSNNLRLMVSAPPTPHVSSAGGYRHISDIFGSWVGQDLESAHDVPAISSDYPNPGVQTLQAASWLGLKWKASHNTPFPDAEGMAMRVITNTVLDEMSYFEPDGLARRSRMHWHGYPRVSSLLDWRRRKGIS